MAIKVFDLCHLAETEQKAEIAAFIDREWRRPFDLSRPPLVRFHIHRLSDEYFQFTFTECHAIVDGWSITSTCAELFKTQLELLRNADLPLQPAPLVHFRDYVHQERLALASRESEEYWAATLADAVPLTLPQIRTAAEKIAGPKMDMVTVPITLQLAASLRGVAAELSVPLKSLFFAVHCKVLGVLCGVVDILTGFNVHGRAEAAGGDDVRGLFLNTLPIRFRLEDNRWSDLIQKAFQTELESLPYRNYPYAELQRKFGPQALLDVQFNYLHFHSIQDALKDGMIEVLGNFDISESNFALIVSWQINPQTSEMSLQLYRDRTVFTDDQIRLMGEYYANALRVVAADPSAYHNATSLLTKSEIHQALVEWNTFQILDGITCVHELFERQVAQTPETTALVFGNQRLSFAELNRRANRLAHWLQGQGVGPEIKVSICLERSAELVVGVLGVLKAGGAYVGLDPLLPLERLVYAFQESGSSIFISSQDILEQMALPPERTLSLEGFYDRLDGCSEENPESGVIPDNLAYIIYTSGSTGTPKAVAGTHRALACYIHGIAKYYEANGAHFALFQNLAVDAPITLLYIALCYGGTLHVLSSESIADPAKVSDYIQHHGIDYFKVAPSYLHAALSMEQARGVVPRRMLMTGGERTHWDLIDRVHLLNEKCLYVNHYGPTETTCGVCVYVPDKVEVRQPEVPLGRPLKHAQIYILDSAMNPQPVGAKGEIYIGGSSLARGYLNHPDLTAERFVPNPLSGSQSSRLYRTGDLGRWLPDGCIEFLGRSDSQVKVNGYRVELGEIEAVLVQHPAIKEVAVVLRGQAHQARLVAYAACSTGEAIGSAELRGFLRTKLPEYMVPEQVVFLDRLPRTLQGKIHRPGLPEVDMEAMEAAPYVAPRNEDEKILCALYEDVLNQERVSVTGNFFDLGGHSLLATRLVTRIRETFSLDLPLRALFETPTVAELAERVRTQKRKSISGEIPVIGRRSKDRPAPLSYAQQRLWFLAQLESGSAAYNLPFALHLTGMFNRDAMRASVQEIVRRHEILRTHFIDHHGMAQQVVNEVLDIPIKEIDLQHLDDSAKLAELERLARADAIQPFDLTRVPLLRITLVQLHERENVLLVTMHHIVSDGWSNEILINEFAALYEGMCIGRPPQLPELKIQYADFAVWQRDWLQGAVLAKEMEYWRGQLAGIAPLELLTDYPRPSALSHRGAAVPLHLDAGVLNDLKARGRREGVTLFMTLLAAFDVLLARYSGQNDIGVGTPVAGRRWSETELLIGFFINTLVIRIQMDGDFTFRELLRRVRETALAAYEHQDVPFEAVVDELQPERNLGRTPLFEVMLTLQNATPGQVRLSNLDVRPIAFPTEFAKFELNLFLSETAEGLHGELCYDTDLFCAQTIDRLGRSLKILLQALVSAPHQRITEVSLLTALEREQILAGWNRTEKQFSPALVHELFEQQAERTPEAVAVMFEGQELSYGELNRRANQLASYLRKSGVGPEVCVGVFLERCLETLVTMMAIWKAGGAYLPLDPQLPQERISFLLRDASPAVVLTRAEMVSDLPLAAAASEIFSVDADWESIEGYSSEDEGNGGIAGSAAYVIYTSGSTGEPKGVVVTQEAAAEHLLGVGEGFAYQSRDRVLQFAALSFDVSLEQLVAPLLCGACVVLKDSAVWEASDFFSAVRRYGVTVANVPPAFWIRLLEEREEEKENGNGLAEESRLRLMIVGGDTMPPAALAGWRQGGMRRAELVNAYGPTEAVITATLFRVPRDGEEDGRVQRVPIGRPLGGRKGYVVSGGDLASIQMQGELHLGRILARGYLNRPELTAEKFVPDPFSGEAGARLYKSGDMARYLEDGQIDFLGRVDNQVKLRGFRIELGEIEAALNQHEGVRESVVVVRGSTAEDKRLVGYVVAGEGARETLTNTELQSHLGKKLPEYMVPQLWVFLEKLPLTANGKVDRRALPEVEGGGIEEYEGPRNAEEEIVCGLWGEVLKQERVGIRANFFELGGHSLLATQLVSRMRVALGVELTLLELFEAPTVAGLMIKIEEYRANAFSSGIPIHIASNEEGAGGSTEQILAGLESLSEEEAQALLSMEERIEEDLPH
jgi:amino acid adenylation domain-containing protein